MIGKVSFEHGYLITNRAQILDISSPHMKGKIRSIRRAYREGGIDKIIALLRYKARSIISDHYRTGENIFEQEWDVLIVLDACRFDLMQEVVQQNQLFDSLGAIDSVGTKTSEWMQKTFTQNYASEMAETVYICGNPNSGAILESDQFALLDEPWRNHWDGETGTMMPDVLTGRAIYWAHEFEPERLLVHYMQPHYPFINAPDVSERIPRSSLDQHGKNDNTHVWEKLKQGKIDRETVWKAYKQNLEFVLDSVAVLVASIDADTVVITSDHGNALGEWGIFGHPRETPIGCLKRVPWIETEASATDRNEATENYHPKTGDDQHPNGEEADESIERKLRHLGYRD